MKIGITGGMGSGKSYVVSLFKELGAVVYYADQKAKELVYVPSIKAQIIAEFGEKAFENDVYQTSYIAPIVFGDATKLQKLNDIIHPAVMEDFQKFSALNVDYLIAYESALIIEAKHTYLFDKIILVTAPVEERIKRIEQRDKLTAEAIKKRMQNQWTDEEKLPYADFVIENINKDDTREAVQLLWHELVPRKQDT